MPRTPPSHLPRTHHYAALARAVRDIAYDNNAIRVDRDESTVVTTIMFALRTRFVPPDLEHAEQELSKLSKADFEELTMGETDTVSCSRITRKVLNFAFNHL